jgi:septum formation protein
MHLILASSSPQRKELLSVLNLPFDVIPSTIDEEGYHQKDPAKRAQELAILKARDVKAKHPTSIVIGCDTLVVSPQGHLLEKPKDEADARAMMRMQSGGRSLVHSGLCVIDADGTLSSDLSTSSVYFAELSDRDIDWWIHTQLWQGRSGAFQIDGLGQLMIKHIEGDFTSIVGLPMYVLGHLLKKAGVSFTAIEKENRC